MTRALLVSASARPGGAERALLGLARALPASDVQPVVALLEDGPLREWLVAERVRTFVMAKHRTRNLAATARSIRKLTSLARDADVVVSSLSKTHVFGGIAARSAGIPAIRWQHDLPNRSAIERAAGLVPAAAIVGVSDMVARAQRLANPRARVVALHPGIALGEVMDARGSGARIRAEQGWNGATVVGLLGRLQPWKGQEAFLQAAALLAERVELRFVLVGGAILGWEGDYAQRLEALARQLGIEDRVTFAGHREDRLAWLDAFDVAVHASRNEPFGISVLEAMALGKPLVAANEGGPTEIVVDGTSGLLAPPDEPAAIAQAIARVLDDGELRTRLTVEAPQRAALFNEREHASRFAELLESVVQPRAARELDPVSVGSGIE